MASRNQTERDSAPTRTVGYVRCSTDKQAEKGLTLEAQEAKLRSYADLYSLDLIEVVVDAGLSAKTLVRPGLERCLGMLKTRRADALLVVKLDRLTRSVRDLGQLVDEYFAEGKSALLSVSEQIDTRTASGRLVLNVLGAVSQWEREAIGERTSAALQHKQSKGEYIGGDAPFGYRLGSDGVALLPEPAEQKVLHEARRLRLHGLSLRAVAKKLHDRGFVSRTGRPFAPVQIQRMTAA